MTEFRIYRSVIYKAAKAMYSRSRNRSRQIKKMGLHEYLKYSKTNGVCRVCGKIIDDDHDINGCRIFTKKEVVYAKRLAAYFGYD